MKNSINFLVSVIIFCGTIKASAAYQCGDIFPAFKVTPEIQKSIEASISALAELKLSLDLQQVQGKSSVDFSALSSDYARKETELSTYLTRHGIMAKSELLALLKNKISALQTKNRNSMSVKDQEARRLKENIDLIRYIHIDGKKAVLHRIEAGTFKMGDPKHPNSIRDVTLTKAFDMMATPTTQVIWRSILDIARKRFGGRDRKLRLVDKTPSHHKGDVLPVTDVTYNDVINWLDILNRLSTDGTPDVTSIIPDHKPGDYYRLPTEAEWEFVARGRGENNGVYLFDPSLLADHVWSKSNSGEIPQPVATKLPLVIGHNDFFDVIGNVRVWTADALDFGQFRPVDPYNHGNSTSRRIVRGGGYDDFYDQIEIAQLSGLESFESYNSLGFRFVREVKP